MGTESDDGQRQDSGEARALCVRLPLAQYRLVRTIAVTRDMANAAVISWAVELLERYVDAGGVR
ncbi:MAG: hypothetical protein ABSF69_17800 [Polyangiaceae bacterium]|jgi:hypothetical protein